MQSILLLIHIFLFEPQATSALFCITVHQIEMINVNKTDKQFVDIQQKPKLLGKTQRYHSSKLALID